MTSLEETERVKTQQIQLETFWPVLVWLLFGLTVLLRLVDLSQIPISESEANLALLSARVAQGQTGVASVLPVYTGVTTVLFFVFGNADFWVRILPIAAGSSLIFLPTLWRDRLGFKKVLALSVAFALVPAITYFSRTIASPIFATAALLWLISLIRLRRWAWAGVVTACLWLSGSFALPLSILAILGFLIAGQETSKVAQFAQDLRIEKYGLIRFGYSLLITLILISTSFFLNPSGLGDIGSFLTSSFDILRSWQPTELIRFAFLLLQYCLVPLFLFAWNWLNIGSRTNETRPHRMVWLEVATFALVFAIFNAGFLLPFSIIIWSMGINNFNERGKLLERKGTIYLPLVFFGVALFVYVSFVAKTWANATYNTTGLGLAILAGLLLYAFAHGFVGLGWSSSLAKRAALTSLGVVLIAGTLAGTFRLVLAAPEKSALHWQNSSVFTDTVLNTLLNEFKESAKFEAGELLFRADTLPNVPYEWLTRNLTALRPQNREVKPQVIITATDTPGSGIESNYRGMVFTGSEKIDWANIDLKSFVAGIFGTDMPTVKNQDYLWVDNSFFSGN